MRAEKIVLCVLVLAGIVALCVGGIAAKMVLRGVYKTIAAANEPITQEQEEQTETEGEKVQISFLEESKKGVRPLAALSGVSKEKVFALRKEAVADSVFAREGYEPSPEVFGAVVSGKPWVAASICSDPKTHKAPTKGLSEETRFINNPTALVALEMPFLFPKQDSAWCHGEDANMMMQEISADSLRKEIEVTYLNLPFQTSKNHSFYAFNGLNARDLGYPYIYVDDSRSTYHPAFLNTPNVSTQVVRVQNFLHVGPSCGARGGCNNGSPRQPMLEFNEDSTPSASPREIYVKLWREQPTSPQDEPDWVERIVILPPESDFAQ